MPNGATFGFWERWPQGLEPVDATPRDIGRSAFLKAGCAFPTADLETDVLPGDLLESIDPRSGEDRNGPSNTA